MRCVDQEGAGSSRFRDVFDEEGNLLSTTLVEVSEYPCVQCKDDPTATPPVVCGEDEDDPCTEDPRWIALKLGAGTVVEISGNMG